MAVRKQEAAQSTRHDLAFEDALSEWVLIEAQKSNDLAERTGNTTGSIKNSKVGDVVVELGPKNAAAGARMVVEAKEDASYTLVKAREEIETAKRNRDAQVGLFVFSR